MKENVLAVGLESGKVGIWDTNTKNKWHLFDAH